MEPSFTWLDLTSSDRDKMRRVLDLFSEQGTVDELGLGSLRDALSDELFPGTSSIQTRLRYSLFVPWIYQRIEKQRHSRRDVAKLAREAELALVSPLLENEDVEGVIGARARNTLTRLPSSVYWAGLVRWGIFQRKQSQGWFHKNLRSLTDARENIGRPDDPGVVWNQVPNWHPRLPRPPESFPLEASLSLTSEESSFLQGRFAEMCAGSLFAWLATDGSTDLADDLWDDPVVLSGTAKIQAVVELARRFSLQFEGAPLLYNLLLAERRQETNGGDEEFIEEYRTELSEWADRECAEDQFLPTQMWEFVAGRGGRLRIRQTHFVETWSSRVLEIGASNVVDDKDLRFLIKEREVQLKKGRARLTNQGRLLDWSGRVGVGRMSFRWARVRQLLVDLHEGLEN